MDYDPHPIPHRLEDCPYDPPPTLRNPDRKLELLALKAFCLDEHRCHGRCVRRRPCMVEFHHRLRAEAIAAMNRGPVAAG